MPLVEEIFVTEGVPQETFVEPPNYGAIFVDIRHPGKPTVIEGQSGTGKTTTVKKIIEKIGGERRPTYLTARNANDLTSIIELSERPAPGVFVIDDFHRLADNTKTRLIDFAKLAAEDARPDTHPKLVIIGINQLGSSLIEFVPDIAKRCGIHQIAPADQAKTLALINRGCEILGVKFTNADLIFDESRGDYWLTQSLAQTTCTSAGIYESQLKGTITLTLDRAALRSSIVAKLDSAYRPAVKEFCRGRRFRPSNDPYFKLLRAVSETGSSNTDLTMLANQRDDVRQSINNIKDDRLSVLLDSKPTAARYFYYNKETKQFSIDDPAAFYYLKHLDWERLRLDCGFKEAGRSFEFDVAISFAGANRDLAQYIAERLEVLDVRVFYDANFEANFMGKTWTKEFERIFQRDSRFVICLLDAAHRERIWPTFERECFVPRIAEEAVLPIFLDETVFPGIPADLVGIKFAQFGARAEWREAADEQIIFKVIDRIG